MNMKSIGLKYKTSLSKATQTVPKRNLNALNIPKHSPYNQILLSTIYHLAFYVDKLAQAEEAKLSCNQPPKR